MKTNSLNCNNCGANLHINENIKFLTCTNCGASLQIVHAGGAIYTRILAMNTAAEINFPDNSEILVLENEIARLDRDWGQEREQYLVRGRYGSTFKPTVGNAILMNLVIIIGGVLWSFFAKSLEVPLFFKLLGFITIVVGVFALISQLGKAKKYEAAEKTYKAKRDKIVNKLKALQINF